MTIDVMKRAAELSSQIKSLDYSIDQLSHFDPSGRIKMSDCRGHSISAGEELTAEEKAVVAGVVRQMLEQRRARLALEFSQL